MTPGAKHPAPGAVIFAGVGGQGVLAAAHLLGSAAHALGFPVVVSQLHGMSQRGGAVRATVSFGSVTALAPDPGPARVLVALEMIEGLRAIDHVGPDTLVLCNKWWLPPARAAGAPVPDPDSILAALRRRAADVYVLDASAMAANAGDPRTVNVVMLGALAGLGKSLIPADALRAAIRSSLPGRAWTRNERAFTLGTEAVAGTPATTISPSPSREGAR